MDKIYLVEASSGSYDDYYKWIEKIFYNPEKAEEYKNTYNQELAKKLELAKKCSRCPIDNFDIEVQQLIKECKLYCNESDIEIKGSGKEAFLNCKNYGYYYSEHHQATVIEKEVE